MARRNGLIAGVLGILIAGSGCVNCGNKGYGVAREVGQDCALPTCQRNAVYVFAIGGTDPLGLFALDGLREGLNKQGFSKVATGQTVHAGWVREQMHQGRVDNPEAVFVLVGFGAGGPTAAGIAEKARAEGLPVAAVVLIDADGRTPPPAGLRTLAVGSGYGVAATSAVESIVVPEAGRFTLASDPRTVAAVAKLLTEVAAGVPMHTTETVAAWEYEHAPEPRPDLDGSRSPEWIYLFDQPGGAIRAAGEPSPVIAAKPAAPKTATARR